MTPNRRLEPAGFPSRFRSFPYSLPVKRESPSFRTLQKKCPRFPGAVYVTPSTVNVPFLALTSVVLRSQVGSLSVAGCVPAIHCTTFRAPVLVFVRLAWWRSTPVSTIPIVTLRPSHVGCAARNAAAWISPIGMYGLSFGVPAPGAGCGCAGWLASGDGSGSGTISSTSADWMASIDSTALTLSTGNEAVT